jgi:putative membrane protein
MIVNISPVSGSESYLYIFICGAIAICALILPGISGSFMLLLMGMYTFIIPKVKAIITDFDVADFIHVFVFCLGCLFGLMAFSRILKYTFENYRDQVIMVLSGLMLGTLSKIWPWRNPSLVIDKNTGEPISTSLFLNDPLNDTYKLISENNVLPSEYLGNPMLVAALACMLLGFGLVIASMFIDTKKTN